MKNWEIQEELGYCPGEVDFEDAKKVCEKLGITLHRVDFVKEYWNNVFLEFLDGIKRGITPNPDIFCNKEIKFNALFNWVEQTLQTDYFATGHYARIEELPKNEAHKTSSYRLKKAVDNSKDQTYFLSNISADVLSKTIFPVGSLLKSQVRKIAQDAGLSTAKKKDSMGICFIGKRNFKEFIG